MLAHIWEEDKEKKQFLLPIFNRFKKLFVKNFGTLARANWPNGQVSNRPQFLINTDKYCGYPQCRAEPSRGKKAEN